MTRSAALALTAAACLGAVSTAAARPVAPAPRGGSLSPPAAWVETAGGDRWLAFSTSCWTRGCIDYISPEMRRDLPRIGVRPGERVVFHLGLEPRALTLRVGRRSYALPASGAPSWRVRGGGVVVLQAFAPRGDAAYVARFIIRSR
ncbi:MAG: hypothetical protein QOK40_431 [Miltoncostaeaceae bacterium]|jgi:hypothetical protein|nr:hypothetical protein [Miltoncostaeaceae bacterium]